MTQPQSPFDAIYNVQRWGDGYFRIGKDGHLHVRPQGDQGGEATLEAVLQACRAAGLRTPVLARFSGILRDRVRRLAGAFRGAIGEQNYQGRYTPPSEQGSLIYPGNFGVFNWGALAVDPERQVAFTTPAYLAFVSTLIPRQDDTSNYVSDGKPGLNENYGAPYAVSLKPFLSPLGLPCQQPPWGYVAGLDLRSGEVVWKHRNGTVRDQSPLPLPFKMGVPDLGGPIVTAGGVAFMSGTIDYYVRAYDVTTGEQLWEDRLPAGGQATPMTYLDSQGRQRLLVVAGGHGSLGTKAGDAIIAYGLKDD